MASAVRSAVQISALGGAVDPFSSRSARNVANAGRQPREEGIEMPDHLRLAADHQAVAAFASPDAAAGSDVDVVHAARGEFLCAPDVIDVVGIAAVDEDVTGRQQWQQVVDGAIDDRCGDHEPDGPWRRQLLHHVCE
jgi:hypothetical protein